MESSLHTERITQGPKIQSAYETLDIITAGAFLLDTVCDWFLAQDVIIQ